MSMIDPIEISDPDIDQSPFEIEALAARYKAERDVAIQARERLEKEVGILRGAERERDMLRDLADVLVVKVIERPAVRTFAEGLDEAEIDDRIDSIIEALDRRLMPSGMEWLVEAWPRFEDDAPVKLGDMALIDGEADMVEAVQLWIHGRPVIYGDGGSQQLDKGERVKRPAPKVLDAGGSEIREKRDAWWICEGDERGVHAERLRVETICPNGLIECSPYNGGTWLYLEPSELYVNKPVPASDRRPLREGEHVWHVETGTELVVRELPKPGEYQAVVVFAPPASHLTSFDPDQLTHERPDSWERLGEDVSAIVDAERNGEGSFIAANAYCERHGLKDGTVWVLVAQDLVRRAELLAGEGR